MTASMIHRSPLADLPIPDASVTDFMLARAGEWPDALAFIDGASGDTLTYRELSEAIRRLAGGFAAEGIGPGTTVALMAPNLPAFAVVFHAVAVAGATVTTINPTYGAAEVNQQLRDAKATLLITVPAFLETSRAAVAGSDVGEIVTIGRAGKLRSIDDLAGEPIEQVPVDVDEANLVLPYSSGTSGLPKGVMLSHRNLVANVMQTNAMIRHGSGDIALAVLPFFHIYGMQVLMCGLLERGMTVVTMPRFDMEQALALIQEHRVTTFFVVPPIVLGLAKHPLVGKYDLSSLKLVFCGAAPLGRELTEEAGARIGCRVEQGYGMTEMSPVSHASGPDHYKPGSSGVTVPNTTCRVIDGSGDDLGTDEEGELLVKGPQVMRGYLGNAVATAETLDEDGWLHTGDIVRIDADGHMFVIDRVKELIKFKGFQVAPAELEALIFSHPDVADVAVIGVPDAEAGELPKAFVVPKPGRSIDADGLRDFVARKVASYKRIHEVAFVESIPKSPSGKILRRVLRASVAAA